MLAELKTHQKLNVNIISNNKYLFKDLRRIEILTNNLTINFKKDHDSIGINLDTNLIFKILSKTFSNIKLTKILNENDLNKLAERKPELVFSGIKYFKFKTKTIWLNEFLDINNINYINSKKSSYNNANDKSLAKIIMQKNGINTPNFFIAKPKQYSNALSLPINFPLFVKPLNGGDSIGIDQNSVVRNFKDFEKKICDVQLNQNSSCIAESYLSGKEFTVGIIQDDLTRRLIAMPVEIVVQKNSDGNRILDYNIKKNDLEEVCAIHDPIVYKKVSKLAMLAFKLLKGRMFGRIDIKMDGKGIPNFIEANLMPGLKKGYFFRCCSINLQITYEQMITKISKNALNHPNR